MAEPVDPRIIDMMRQKARTEAPPPKDFEDLMRKVLDADPQSVRLVEESFDLGGLTPQEYATQFLGADAGLMDMEARRFDEQKQYANQLGIRPMPMPSNNVEPMDMEARQVNEQKQYANQLGMRPMFTPSDESQYMKKVFKSLLEAAEEKGKEQK
jgi:hypothetical protein